MTTDIRFTADSEPWPTRAADHQAARELLDQMTLEEKVSLVIAPMGYGPDAPDEAIGSAAHSAGLPRLGIPPWDESDASLGVTNPMSVRGDDEPATAFPAGLALGATFDPSLAEAQGGALGAEAKATGMSVQLAGGMNLVREPRGGRNFEYIGEDPLLSGIIAGASVRGIQGEGVVSTVKHFAVNPQETGRVMASSDLAEPALRESDLLAFQIAIEHGGPRSVMTGYNLVNRLYASENPWLLTTVLKGDWGYGGFVMSDWGGTHSAVHAAVAGLDRQSGPQMDTSAFYGKLTDAVQDGTLPEARLDDMVTRIVAALRSVGALGERRARTPLPQVTRDEHAATARSIAQRSIVLLRNTDDILPLSPDLGRVVVVGAGADDGVLSGGGSSTVTPPDASQEEGFSIAQLSLPKVRHRPAPVDELRRALADAGSDTDVVYIDSDDKAVGEIRPDDTVIVFAEKWATEGRDQPSLAIDDDNSGDTDQDGLIAAVAEAAGHTVVVLVTPGAVTMPWLEDVDAVVEAWYGGSGGAPAIADVLVGAVNPSGRLPVSFPRSESQLPRTEMVDPSSTTSNPGEPRKGSFPLLNYDIEGADVGYRWYSREGLTPLFWFGHGLSYTTFSYDDISAEVSGDGIPRLSLRITNTGSRAGTDVPQMYLAPPDSQFRLVGWAPVTLDPGESTTVRINADDARTYAGYRVDDPGWVVAEGDHRLRLARSASAGDVEFETTLSLPGAVLAP